MIIDGLGLLNARPGDTLIVRQDACKSLNFTTDDGTGISFHGTIDLSQMKWTKNGVATFARTRNQTVAAGAGFGKEFEREGWTVGQDRARNLVLTDFRKGLDLLFFVIAKGVLIHDECTLQRVGD